MDDRSESWRLGPYEVTRHLGPGRLTDRWLAIHEGRQTTHVVHEFLSCHANAERRRFLRAIEAASVLSHPHLLPVQELGFSGRGQPFVITPYTGSQDGLLTLGRLAAAKGRMSPSETERAMTQLLQAAAHAHATGRAHGPVEGDEILVDRRGCLWVELYGVRRSLTGSHGAHAEAVREEVRSVVELGYRLLTGIGAEEPRIPAERLVKRLDRRWDAWLDAGLDPVGGFDSAAEALSMLPGAPSAVEAAPATIAVRRALGRFASAIWAGTREQKTDA